MSTPHYSTSFAQRLSIIVIALSSLLFLVGMAVVACTGRHLITQEATQSAANLLEATIKDVEKELCAVEVATANAAWLVKEHGNDQEYLYRITRQLVDSNDHIVGSAIAFVPDYFPGKHYFAPYTWIDEETGKRKRTQLGSGTYDYFYMDWFQVPRLTGKPSWSEPYYDENGGEQWVATYSRPLRDADGQVYAVITADISLAWLSTKFGSIQPYPGAYTNLVSRSGTYVCAPFSSWLGGDTIFSHAAEMHDPTVTQDLRHMVVDRKRGVFSFSEAGVEYFSVYGPLCNGWSAAIICPYREVLRSAMEMTAVLLAAGLAGLLGIFLLCRAAVTRETRPLSAFSESARAIASGNFDTPLPRISTRDEIAQLRDSFDYMQASLKQYMADLERTTAGKQRLESELSIAHDIQMNMLPTDFPPPGPVDLYAGMTPAREVGGDLYDFTIRGHHLYFAIGDVSGKGVSAALIMAITRSALRLVGSTRTTLDNVVAKINRCIAEYDSSGMFVTLLTGHLDLQTLELEYCNAGHNPPVVIPAAGQPHFLPLIPNLVVGAMDDFPFRMQRTQLQPGDSLLLYTDGVTEAEAPAQDQYGEARLLNWAHHLPADASARQAVESLTADLHAFTCGNEQNDDITIMAIRLRPQGSQA